MACRYSSCTPTSYTSMLSIDGESSQRIVKKFYRRTVLFTWLWCTAILNAVEDKGGHDWVSKSILASQGSIEIPQIPHRPFAPHVKLNSASEIRVSWLPVLVSNRQAVRYELFSSDDPEYVGYDLVYIAKRLKPGTEYKFKVRACSVTGCSDFSLIRSCRTAVNGMNEVKGNGGKPYFGRRRIFLFILPPLAIVTFIATLIVLMIYIWRFLRYYLWQCSFVSFDATLQKTSSTDKALNLENFIFDLEMGEQQQNLSKSSDSCVQLTSMHDLVPEQVALLDIQNLPHNGVSSQSEVCPDKCDQPKRYKSKSTTRGRASSLGVKVAVQEVDSTRVRSASEGETVSKRVQNETMITFQELITKPITNNDALIVIDNSNVFIGAREAACSLNPKLRPRHVKVRLQALTEVLEDGRNVTKKFVCGSSPPANESVWDVYRRLGYNIDLEDRRGKDEQRVDEQLHLCIYKAIIEMSPQTLVLASGDGSKGKSSGGTSFPDCVSAAIEHGWNVEVHSWKHSLSAEWLKIAAKHKVNFKIKYLDENINRITSVDNRVKNRDRTDDNLKEQRDNCRFRA